jgi:hypothetical protein
LRCNVKTNAIRQLLIGTAISGTSAADLDLCCW